MRPSFVASSRFCAVFLSEGKSIRQRKTPAYAASEHAMAKTPSRVSGTDEIRIDVCHRCRLGEMLDEAREVLCDGKSLIGQPRRTRCFRPFLLFRCLFLRHVKSLSKCNGDVHVPNTHSCNSVRFDESTGVVNPTAEGKVTSPSLSVDHRTIR